MSCFALAGEEEMREAEIEGTKREMWMVKREGWDESGLNYLSVDAATLELG